MTQEVETLGEARVRIKFNPSNNEAVYKIKAMTAELINMCERMRPDPKTQVDDRAAIEVWRLLSLAQTHYEDAAMWAAKAATAPQSKVPTTIGDLAG